MTRIINISFLLFLSLAMFGQNEKGFEALKNKDYWAARIAFRQDLDHPIDGIAAKYGLASCYLEQSGSMTELTDGIVMVREAAKAYGELDFNKRRRITKYKVSKNSLSKLDKALQKRGITIIKNGKSVLKLDTFMNKVKPVEPSLEIELKNANTEAVQYAMRYAQDYPTLSSLVKNHYVTVATLNYRYSGELQNRLFRSFLWDPTLGMGKLDKFKSDHPNHSFSIDCWSDELIDAVKNPQSVKKLIRFLIDYPYSALDGFASTVLQQNTYNGMFIPNQGELSPEEVAKLKDMKQEWDLAAQYENSPRLPDTFAEVAFKSIESSAPSRRSYTFMKQVLQKFLVNRQWDPATMLIKKTKPLFPDVQPDSCETRFYFYSEKQPWYKGAIPIVEKEAEGIIREPVNPLNTLEGDEFSPVITVDGMKIFFAATGRPENKAGEDIFMAEFDVENRTWKTPKLVEELSSNGDESPLSMTNDGNELLLFRDGKLYTSRLEEEGWTEPKKLPETINKFKWIGRACFSGKGGVMLFSATDDPEEIYGDSNIDIYVSKRDGKGQWGKAKKLGPDINTFKEERSPFLYPDNKTLYFSSRGHKGLGEMDIFKSERLDDTWENWSVPKNLGKEINTLEDDWGYNYSVGPIGNTVYISADEYDSGLGDIFNTGLPEFVAPDKLVPVQGKIAMDEDSRTEVVITDAETGEVIDTVETRPDGSFTVVLEEDQVINYHVADEELFPVSGTIDPATREDDPYRQDTLETIPIAEMLDNGKPAPLNNILFDFDKATLQPRSIPELMRLFRIVEKTDWMISIEGHTDNQGTATYNKRLSQDRAQAVVEFLKERGISSNRMKAIGYGMERPVASNDTEAGQAENRRVEIRFSRS